MKSVHKRLQGRWSPSDFIQGHNGSEKVTPINLDMILLDGGVLVKTIILSIDPYIRRRMLHPSEYQRQESAMHYVGSDNDKLAFS